MRVASVRTATAPRYPTHGELNVENHIPRRWARNPVALALLMTAVPIACPKPQAPPLTGKVAAPSFLSESEADAIIKAEAKRFGIKLSKTKKEVRFKVAVAGSKKLAWLKLDEADAKHGIYFEYVSREEAAPFKVSASQMADALREDLKSTGRDKKVGVFNVGSSSNTFVQRTELRRQVRTFLEWLKSQGVI